MQRRVRFEYVFNQRCGNHAVDPRACCDDVAKPRALFDHDQCADTAFGKAQDRHLHLVDDLVFFRLKALQQPVAEEFAPADVFKRPAQLRLEQHHEHHDTGGKHSIEHPAERLQLEQIAYECGQKKESGPFEQLKGSRFLCENNQLVQEKRDDGNIDKVLRPDLREATRDCL